MLGTNQSCTCHSFPTRWSPFFFWCNNTCWNWHFFVLIDITRCLNLVTPSCPPSSPTLWKPNNLILSPVANFFGGSPIWTRVYFAFSRHSFKYYAITFPLMCGFNNKHLIISSSYHTYISFILSPLPYNIMYMSWFSTSYSCPSFLQCQCGHTIDDLCTHLFRCPCKSEHTTPNTLWDIITTIVQKDVSHFFPCHIQQQVDILIIINESRPWWTSSLLTQLAQIWCSKHQRWQHI